MDDDGSSIPDGKSTAEHLAKVKDEGQLTMSSRSEFPQEHVHIVEVLDNSPFLRKRKRARDGNVAVYKPALEINARQQAESSMSNPLATKSEIEDVASLLGLVADDAEGGAKTLVSFLAGHRTISKNKITTQKSPGKAPAFTADKHTGLVSLQKAKRLACDAVYAL
ncbi:hypothetical protein M427DRAFT_32554 [Gonapodya prolifera JEL478]|uniref:Uncharacterized protein n=1 Tax=Gonapodya prolifera (strain JEL478) TaxID=1344416 RepID=A0A139AEG2_GONPJ|nr:hypothetical protein M427DRAFT_32554 [Gonapodya prolifera JEL478]|eukprot:KXS15069.1 hypothetical protein M427DRAFT_32554 [Gonapodya prolifera JEL478]